MNNIRTLTEKILASHCEKLKGNAGNGNIRALEIRWQEANREFHGRAMPGFTDRERGNVKLLVEGLGGAEVERLLSESVQYWGYLLQQPSLERLPPLPTFGSLFAYRETIRAFLDAREKKEIKAESANEKMKRYEQEYLETPKPKVSLLEMAQAERKKIQDGKGNKYEDSTAR